MKRFAFDNGSGVSEVVDLVSDSEEEVDSDATTVVDDDLPVQDIARLIDLEGNEDMGEENESGEEDDTKEESDEEPDIGVVSYSSSESGYGASDDEVELRLIRQEIAELERVPTPSSPVKFSFDPPRDLPRTPRDFGNRAVRVDGVGPSCVPGALMVRSQLVDEERCLATFREAASRPIGRHLLDLDFVLRITDEGLPISGPPFLDPLLVLMQPLMPSEVDWFYNELPWRDHVQRSSESFLQIFHELGAQGVRSFFPDAPPRLFIMLRWFATVLENEAERQED